MRSPSNPALLGLNVNGGQEVKLRLRRQNNEWDFFPYEQILDTMLHELCHNQFGPHNADFYNLLDEIRKAYMCVPHFDILSLAQRVEDCENALLIL
ncbi:DNA-dependent metalloprotease WSS1-like protein [Tanacetum coccineum]